MTNIFTEPPFILCYMPSENVFKHIPAYSYTENNWYNTYSVKECVIKSYSSIPYLSNKTDLLIFSPIVTSDLNDITDIDQILTLISCKDTIIESFSTRDNKYKYKAFITCNEMSFHDYYHRLLNRYNKYLHEQDSFNDIFKLDKDVKSRINTLFKRKFEDMNEILIFHDDLNVTYKIAKTLAASITYSNCSLRYWFGPQIDKVIFANPKTIVLWSDGTKTIATCQKDAEFLKEIGFAIAVAKKTLGGWSNFQNYIDSAIISGTKADHVDAKQRRKEKCLQKNSRQ